MRASVNISLPESMKAWVDEQVTVGGYGTTSEFFRQLIREARQRQLRVQIDRRILAALDSGDPITVTPQFWEERRKEIEERIKQSNSTA